MNKHRYVVATQSQTLRSQLRSIPGVPILHINRSVMILEPPSDATLRSKALTEEKALHATGSEKPQSDAGPVPKKRKGPKGPNPLSVKKKKPDPKPAATTKPRSSETAIVGEKRKREDVKEAQESQAEPEMKKKRKRRRKATDTDASVTQSVD
ncbi:unnamed protein product [Mycena citricolor]|nr:unnamed protein product [Mycena citricolor]CAK5279964.1 unnamed protein product [Mycena citricolor]